MSITPATYLTLARIALVPVFAAFAIAYGLEASGPQPREWLRYAALATFITASLTDAVDGYLARHCGQKSRLGAFLDPAADKLLLLTALLVLSIFEWGPNWSIPLWLLVIIVARDLMIVGGYYFLKARGKSLRIAPTWTGKVCTVFQLIAIGWVMLKAVPLSPRIPALPAAIFTLWSGLDYFRMGLRRLRQEDA